MANAVLKTTLEVDIKVTLELTLEEAIALNTMTCYGAKAFLQGYYKQLGKSYLQPHEQGIISLFETIKKCLPDKLEKAEKIMKSVESIKQTP